MTINAIQFAQGTLTNTLTTTLGTVPAATKFLVKEIILANTSASPVNATVRFGGTGVSNTILPAVSLAGNSINIFSLSTVLPANTVISGGDSVGGVVGFTISGVNIT